MSRIPLILLLIALTTGALAQTSKPTLSIGGSSTSLVGLEYETFISPELTAFAGLGGFALPLPNICTPISSSCSPGVTWFGAGMVSLGVRYWFDGKPEGLFGELGGGLLVGLPMAYRPIAFTSIAYRYGLPDYHFDIGISGLVWSNPVQFSLLPRITWQWVFKL